MKLQIVSDLHLEFEDCVIENAGADVLILAGDICTAYNCEQYRPFFERVSRTFPHVLYVLGNHEFYKSDIGQTYDTLARMLDFDNVLVLDNTVFRLGDIEFVGSTLWTDCNGNDPLTMRVLQDGMNDFRIISWKSKSHWRFRPEDSVELHRKARKFIEYRLRKVQGGKRVVITHHAPSRLSINEKYANEYLMNGGFASDVLTEDFVGHADVPLWIHGHIHDCADYHVGRTRVICNPKGYRSENPLFYPRLVVEV